MRKSVDMLLASRADAPYPGIAFDAWLLPIVLELLAPLERDCMDVLLLGEPRDEWVSTPDLAGDIGRTLEQMGAVLSRLRGLGLVETSHETTEEGRTAYHRAVAWVVDADRCRLTALRNTFEELSVARAEAAGLRRVLQAARQVAAQGAIDHDMYMCSAELGAELRAAVDALPDTE